MKTLWLSTLILLLMGCSKKNGNVVKRTNKTHLQQGTLLLSILNVESSYLKNMEKPARGIPDTLQWWIGKDESWRIKTFAMDHDIHIYRLDNVNDPLKYFKKNNEKHYGDVILKTYVLEFSDVSSDEDIKKVFKEASLRQYYEKTNNFLFWKPDKRKYKTQSKPK